jgi:hypothetical protein
MKKLNLQLDSIKEMLTKEQMKKIVGGYGSTGCINTCNSDCPCKDSRDWVC